jgi:dTDP-4-amino-4,6-dideoxygalactose transaminase
MACYPPAETKVPWDAIFSAFLYQPGEFDADLRRFLKVDHCILGHSARALLFKLLEKLKKLNDNQHDEVLIPGYTCYSVAAAIARAGLKITVYDLEPTTLYPDLDSFNSALSEKTLAVITQHLFGIQTPLADAKKKTNRYDAFLIEDAAQSFGIDNTGKVTGTEGDFGLFSFGRGKPLPIGCGGALVSQNHPQILDKIHFDRPKKGYKQAVVSAAVQIASKPALYWIPELLPIGLGQTVYDPDFQVEAMPYAMIKILSSALPHLSQLNAHRKRITAIYHKYLANEYQIKSTENVTSVIRFPVKLPNPTQLTKALSYLGVRKMYPKAIINESIIRPYLRQNQIPTPGAVEISKRLLTLPTHLRINEKIAKRICYEINQFGGER